MAKIVGKAAFLSDIHLGNKACNAKALNSFLDKLDVDILFLVGDIIDLWKLNRGWYWDKEHSKALRKILKHKNVIYIPGNHDEWFRDYIGEDFGNISIHRNYVYESIDWHKLLIFHGDEIDKFVLDHKSTAMLGAWMYDLLIELNTFWRYTYWLVRRKQPKFSISLWLKHKAKEATQYMGGFEAAAVEYARSHGCDGAICGHIHNPVASHPYYNCGDWVENCTYILESHEGRFIKGQWKDE